MSPPENTIPDLASYHAVVVNSSAGKDSSAMLDLVVELADGAGCRDRLVVVHADLGRVEWPGTAELAARQASRYGLRFEVVRRERGDLLHQVEHERGRWPDAARRYCTSDAKVGQIVKLFTRLTAASCRDRHHFRWSRLALEQPVRSVVGQVRCQPAFRLVGASQLRRGRHLVQLCAAGLRVHDPAQLVVGPATRVARQCSAEPGRGDYVEHRHTRSHRR